MVAEDRDPIDLPEINRIEVVDYDYGNVWLFRNIEKVTVEAVDDGTTMLVKYNYSKGPLDDRRR